MNNKNFKEGLLILFKYLDDDDFTGYAFGHDQMWIVNVDKVYEEDKIRLLELGWMIDEDSFSCWG